MNASNDPRICPACRGHLEASIDEHFGNAWCATCRQCYWFLRDKDGMRLYSSAELPLLKEKFAQILSDLITLSPEEVHERIFPLLWPESEESYDSLDVMELLIELEEEFDLSISDLEAERINSIQKGIESLIRSAVRRSLEA